MEQLIINNHIPYGEDIPESEGLSTERPFIQANTVESSLKEIREHHIIPVFTKDNEPVISHADFIEITGEVVSEIFHAEAILKPNIRLSHPIKGRIPGAKDKPACELKDDEKTLYYERMAFIIEIPSISESIEGQPLSLTIGGVKAYNLDNLYNRKGIEEHFKVFIGFKNRVCTNLCVSTDGFLSELKVKNLQQLKSSIRDLANSFNALQNLEVLSELPNYSLSEKQFASLLGRCRMYHHLPPYLKSNIPPLLLGDTQLGMVCKDYYRDNSFCRDEQGNINLWRLYNLLTGANKSTYIDSFLDRGVNAYQFTQDLQSGLKDKSTNWFLN